MNAKEKTAILSTALNLALTLAKFLLYFFTGSLAILAEAWHSFSDIGTSAIVYLAVRFQKREKRGPSGITLEHIISLGIGIFLLIIAISLLFKIPFSLGASLERTVISGILFLLFSVGSFFVYKFETSVGTEKKSAALISDGLHSKADMVAAFLTGISLILYRLGINIDKHLAMLIALLILSFAVESIVQFLNPHIRKNPQLIGQYRSYELIASLFNPQTILKGLRALDHILGKPLTNRPRIRNAIKRYAWLVILLPLLWYAGTSLIVIGPRQEGMRIRFGRPANKTVPLGPGLHFKFPWPIEKIAKVNTREIRKMHIGNITDKEPFALLWTKEHGSGEPFLSGDNNYFHPYIILHYRIRDIFDFTFLHKEPESELNSMAHRIVTQLFATNTFFDIATRLRGDLINQIHQRLQKEMDTMRLGIELLSINTKDTHPPIFIADAFENVIAAFQEKEQMINTANGYRNQKLPEARGEAVKRIAEAEAYNLEKEHQAKGEASRFIKKMESWQKAPEINRDCFYLQRMKVVLKDKDLIILDPRAGKPQIWMEFTNFPDFSDLIQGDTKR